MKKKLGAVLIAGIMACTMAFGLSACGGRTSIPEFEMPEGGFDTTKEVTITFYHQMGSDLRDIIDEYIKEFNAIYPNIHVDHKSYGDWNGIKNQLITEINGRLQANVAFCYPDHVAEYNKSRRVVPLNDFLPDGAFKDVKVTANKIEIDPDEGTARQVLDADGNPVTEQVSLGLTAAEKDLYNPRYYDEGYCYDDGTKMYTLPWIKSTEMMFYNRDFFEKNDLQVPTTWDEMEDLCKRILEINPDCTPFGYDSTENWFITMCEQYGSDYTSATGDHFLFDNPTNRAFVQKFADWYKKGYFTTSGAAGTYTSELFLQQELYMSIGSTGGATYNVDLGSEDESFDVGIAPVPQVTKDTTADHSKTKLISQGPSICIFQNEDPQKVLASWLFVKFCTTNPRYQFEVASNNGYMPALKESVMLDQVPAYESWIANAEGDKTSNNYVTAQAVKVGMEYENSYFVSPVFRGSALAREQVGLLFDAAISGTSIDEAFKTALNRCVAKYGK